ncbi:acetyl-CoA carboxylase biotin carboxylase subunit family protein [Streptomyces sp. NPDC055966]|uniref:ATP-grasp domain-containing protein n=1 Tax=Streptomyces sp. NPDC055966 TaxID=3345669 RepID=UPI0035DCE852
MKKIIILGVNATSAKYVPQALRSAGFEPVFLADPDAFAGQAAQSLRGCSCVPVNIQDRAAVLRALADDPSITDEAFAITGLYDEKFPLIAQIAATYDLHGPEPVAVRLASKGEVAALIPEFSPATIRFTDAEAARLAVDPAALTPAPDGYVLKPAEQAGGRGATRLPQGAGPVDVWNAVAATGLSQDGSHPWVLQADIRGSLFSLEGYVTDGRIVFIDFSQRGRIAWTEVSNLLPADRRLPHGVEERCKAAVTALVERSGLAQGYFHCEFLVGGGRPYLIDANVGRLGGGAMVEQLALSHGLDPVEIIAHVLTLGLPAAGTSPEPAYGRQGSGRSTLSYYYGLEGGGQVTSVSVPDDGRCLHTQVVPDGGRVGPVGTGDSVWVGMLTGFTSDVARDIENVVVHTADGPRPPAWVAPS